MTKIKALFTANQVLAFLIPIIDNGAGLLAAWLFVHLHFLGVFHVTQSETARTISGVAVYAVTAGLLWASHHFHWLPLAQMALARVDKPTYTQGSTFTGLQGPPGPAGPAGPAGPPGPPGESARKPRAV